LGSFGTIENRGCGEVGVKAPSAYRFADNPETAIVGELAYILGFIGDFGAKTVPFGFEAGVCEELLDIGDGWDVDEEFAKFGFHVDVPIFEEVFLLLALAPFEAFFYKVLLVLPVVAVVASEDEEASRTEDAEDFMDSFLAVIGARDLHEAVEAVDDAIERSIFAGDLGSVGLGGGDFDVKEATDAAEFRDHFGAQVGGGDFGVAKIMEAEGDPAGTAAEFEDFGMGVGESFLENDPF
jgi:hypothetical protein